MDPQPHMAANGRIEGANATRMRLPVRVLTHYDYRLDSAMPSLLKFGNQYLLVATFFLFVVIAVIGGNS